MGLSQNHNIPFLPGWVDPDVALFHEGLQDLIDPVSAFLPHYLFKFPSRGWLLVCVNVSNYGKEALFLYTSKLGHNFVRSLWTYDCV